MTSLNFNNVADLCIPIVASILGIAFPIIVQTIGRIDDRYNTIRLVKRFKKEPLYLYFRISLAITIILLIYNNTVFFPWQLNWGKGFNEIIQNSSDILVLLSTSVLIILLFSVVNLIIQYYDYKDLFHRIKYKLYSSNKIKNNLEESESDIYDLVELVKFIIKKDDQDTLNDFYQFLYDYIIVKTKDTDLESIVFDNWAYNTILSLNDILCRENIRSISIVNVNDIVKLLIPVYKPEGVISNESYQVLWRALEQQLFYDKTEWVFEYWTYAYQFAWLYLKPLERRVNYFTNGNQAENKNEEEVREKQIMRFKEFHLALCGLLLYLKKYELIKTITSYSQSQPYNFPLVPSSFQEIVLQFSSLNNIEWEQPFHFGKFYPFMGVGGLRLEISL